LLNIPFESANLGRIYYTVLTDYGPALITLPCRGEISAQKIRHRPQSFRFFIAAQPIRRLRVSQRLGEITTLQALARFRHGALSLLFQCKQQRQISLAATTLRTLRVVGLAHGAAHEVQMSSR